jgi:hypothetical protein
VKPYIRKVIEEQSVPCLEEYLDRLREFEDYAGNVITTHKRLLNLRAEQLLKYDAVIIDEDIILKSVASNQCEISVSQLNKVLGKTTNPELASKIRSALKQSKTKPFFTLPAISMKEKDEDGISTPIDIPSFCMATHFGFRKASEEKNLQEDCIVFLRKAKFYENVKYIMVSATANEQVCKYYWGEDRVVFHECKSARYAGTLNQYHYKSMSRAVIDGLPDIFGKIKRHTGCDHTITFKKYNRGELYYGNTEGCNYLAGENIDVIGTPYQAEFLYKLFPYTIGLDFDETAKIKPNIPVTHNGCKFRFTTYEDEVLRNIQFWMIESELEQAVGRARLLRNDCTVNLFSNFPLRQANLIGEDFTLWT